MEEGGGCGTSGDPSTRQSCETLDKEDHFPLDHQLDQSQGEDLTLMWTGSPFGGLVADVVPSAVAARAAKKRVPACNRNTRARAPNHD